MNSLNKIWDLFLERIKLLRDNLFMSSVTLSLDFIQDRLRRLDEYLDIIENYTLEDFKDSLLVAYFRDSVERMVLHNRGKAELSSQVRRYTTFVLLICYFDLIRSIGLYSLAGISGIILTIYILFRISRVVGYPGYILGYFIFGSIFYGLCGVFHIFTLSGVILLLFPYNSLFRPYVYGFGWYSYGLIYGIIFHRREIINQIYIFVERRKK